MGQDLRFTHHIRRLFFAGPVVRIIGGLDLREPLHASGVDLSDPLLGLPFGFDLAIPQDAFQGDEPPFLKCPGELGQALPGVDAVPLGAGFVVALVVLPALLCSDVEDDVLAVVLGGFGFCVLSEAADEDDFVEHGV